MGAAICATLLPFSTGYYFGTIACFVPFHRMLPSKRKGEIRNEVLLRNQDASSIQIKKRVC